MKVRNIHLFRFRGFEDLQIQFPKDAQMIVFIGENGSGKTSLLDGISLILRDLFWVNHHYDAVNWNDPFNVNNNFEYGSLEIGLESDKNYEFSRSFFKDEDKFRLKLTSDDINLNVEDKINYYIIQGDIAAKDKLNQESISNYTNALSLIETKYGKNIFWANINLKIGQLVALMGETHQANMLFKLILSQSNDLNPNMIAQIHYFKGETELKNFPFEQALESFLKALEIQEKILSPNDLDLAKTYYKLGSTYQHLNKYEIAIKYYEKHNLIIHKNEIHYSTFNNIGVCYARNENLEKAIDFYNKAMEVNINLPLANSIIYQAYENLIECYKIKKDEAQVEIYNNKKNELIKNNNYFRKITHDFYSFRDYSTTQDLSNYLQSYKPIILHYTAKSHSIENFKDALEMAFNIPMTTDFEMIADWFTEHENDENRKRLRVDNQYRSEELEIIRKVIHDGICYLNDFTESNFVHLQTEIDDNVKDGKVSSWLSIQKNGVAIHVNQLSDGEKRVLVLLIDIARRMINASKLNKIKDFQECKGIVLIDEIEQHLHPKWQRTLLPTLNKLFPNLQFIVTTHSPLVVSNLFSVNSDNLLKLNSNVAVYKLTSEKVTLIQTSGRDVANVLGEFFGVERRNSLYQQKIDSLYEAFEEENINKEDLKTKLNELKMLLGASDPDVQSAEIIVNGLLMD